MCSTVVKVTLKVLGIYEQRTFLVITYFIGLIVSHTKVSIGKSILSVSLTKGKAGEMLYPKNTFLRIIQLLLGCRW